MRRSVVLPGGAGACLLLGYVLPWLSFGLGLHRVSYSGLELPVLRWVSAVWVLVLLTALAAAVLHRRRATCIVAAAVCGVSTATAIGTLFAVSEIPSFLKRDLLPNAARDYTPTVSLGPGLFVLTAGCILATYVAINLAVMKVARPAAKVSAPPDTVRSFHEDDDELWEEATW